MSDRPGRLQGKERAAISRERGTRRKILRAALDEFAARGFEGARVERISREAGVNKAMIFYYFSSKRNLYRHVIREALADFVPLVQKAVSQSGTPERLFETLPGLFIRFFAQNRSIIKMIGRELIHAPRFIAPLVREVLADRPDSPVQTLPQIIKTWYRRGLISESDPVHFVFNVVPLCLFPLIAQPMVEAILDVRISDESEFLERRIQSINNLLKRGMLT